MLSELALPRPILRAAGVACLLGILAYLAWTFTRRRPIRVKEMGVAIAQPGALASSDLEIAAAAGPLFVLSPLPDTGGGQLPRLSWRVRTCHRRRGDQSRSGRSRRYRDRGHCAAARAAAGRPVRGPRRLPVYILRDPAADRPYDRRRLDTIRKLVEVWAPQTRTAPRPTPGASPRRAASASTIHSISTTTPA
jgi:hypothetical protein